MSLPALDYDALSRAQGWRAAFRAAIDGMTCAACIGEIESALHKLQACPRASTTPTAGFRWNGGKAYSISLAPSSACAGWLSASALRTRRRTDRTGGSKRLLRCLAIAAFRRMNIMLLSVAYGWGKSDIDPATRDMFHGLSR